MNSGGNRSAYTAAILYALIIGFSFMFMKVALKETGPFDILAHRFTVSFILLTIPVAFGWLRLNSKPKDLVSILPLAVLYPTMFFAFQAFGLVYTSSSEAGIIQAMIPVFTLLLASYFLKERTTSWQKISLLVSVSGVILIFLLKGAQTAGSQGGYLGALLILISALSTSGYNVMARTMTKKFKLLDLTYIMTAIGFVVFNVMAIGRHVADGTLSQFFQPFASPVFIGAILYLSVLSSIGTSFLSNYALSKMEATRMSTFVNLATLVTIVAGVLILNEQLAYYHIIGAILIVAGIVGTNILTAKKTAVPPHAAGAKAGS